MSDVRCWNCSRWIAKAEGLTEQARVTVICKGCKSQVVIKAAPKVVA